MESNKLLSAISEYSNNDKLQVTYDEKTKEITVVVDEPELIDFLEWVKVSDSTKFTQLIDLCVVDYLTYGQGEWQTEDATNQGFSRGAQRCGDAGIETGWNSGRFAVVYHLLSMPNNFRVRIKSFVPDANMFMPSVVHIWPVANWYEREAFDLFGVLFRGHPDLRRILTDYGFIGHPFRKDFPLSGRVEVRYDETLNRVVYEPVSIEPRTLVPKTIRSDKQSV